MKYDSTLIYTFAQRLYARANSIIVSWTVGGIMLGAAIGAIGGWLVNQNVAAPDPKYMWYVAGAGAIIVGMTGFRIGTDRAFSLKLQAQVALCQVKIEENTRGRPAV